MMEIKITIELPGVPEAINNLAAAIMKQQADLTMHQIITNATPQDVQPTASVQAVQEAIKKPEPPVTPEIVQAPAQPEAAVEPAPVKEAPVATEPPAKQYTREEIASAGSALVTQGKMEELLALLAKYNVASVAQLPAEQYNAFANDLKALGAAL